MVEEFREIYVEPYGFVRVNNLGTCVIGKKGKPLSIHWRSEDGYVLVRLNYGVDGRKLRLQRSVHRLVALAFVENPCPEEYREVNHIDGNKENNAADNLEWCSHIQNVRHAWRTGLSTCRSYQGENNGRHRLDRNAVQTVREMHKSGTKRSEIAKMFNVGWTTVNHVIKGETWKN